MINLIIFIILLSKLGMLNGWLLALMIIKICVEVFKLGYVCMKVGAESEK